MGASSQAASAAGPERAVDQVADAHASAEGGEPASGGTARAARNVVAVVAGELLGKGATLVFTVVVARTLGAASFGSLSYALAFGMLLATLVTWGFDAELIRRGSADRTDLEVAFAQALVLRALHAVPIVAVGALVGALTRPSAGAAWALLLVLLATTCDSFGDAGRAAATAMEQLGRVVVALVAQRVLACALAVLVLRTGGGLVEVAGAYLLSSILGQACLALLLRRMGLRARWSAATPEALLDMWRRTFLIGVDAVLSMALFRLDALMLGALAGDRAVAAYAVAYRLMETVLFVNWAVSRSLLPAMVRAGAGAPLLRVGQNAMSVVGALLVPYGTLVLVDGADLIRLLFGEGYGQDSVTALQLLAFAPVAFAASYFGSYLLIVQQRKRQLLLSTVLAVVVNAALNVVLIPAHGAGGAAAATLASYAAQALLGVVLVAPGNGVLRVDLALVLPAVAAVPMALALTLLHLPVVAEAGVGTATYLLTYLLLARSFDPAQLRLVASLVRRP